MIDQIKDIVDRYNSMGEDNFYNHLVMGSMEKIAELRKTKEFLSIGPEGELLKIHDKFLQIFRRTGERVYLEIAILLRRCAHKVYRTLLNQKLINSNAKFLRIV
jgi:hypothetical protein